MSKTRYIIIKDKVAIKCKKDKGGYYHRIKACSLGEGCWNEAEYIEKPYKVIKLPKGVK